MKTRTVGVISLATLLAIIASPVAAAATYYGPRFVLPPSISPGSTINIVVTTVASSTFVAPPTGSQLCPGGVCDYPLQACTSAPPPYTNPPFYYLIHQVTVTDPKGNSYMLGSATTSGLYWPASLGGSGSGTHVPPQADALNVTVGDSFTIPFGQGAGGFSFTSLLGNPPNDVSPAGPYYWWTVSGNQYGSNLRLDQNPNINPTTIQGKYIVDIEGVVVCQNVQQEVTIQLFFDAGIIVTTPEFLLSTAMVAVSSFAVLALLLRAKKLPSLSR
jgi:hypothetical protein